MDSHPYANALPVLPIVRLESNLRLCCRDYCKAGVVEREEALVAVRVNLTATLPGDCRSEEITMSVQDRRVSVAKEATKARTALDVREK
jgi:hypothetical protein